MPAGLTEAETRRQRIDRYLIAAGWREVGIDFEAEFEVGSASAPEHGFIDYALRSDNGYILAIVEAKRSTRDALVGIEQARLYADEIQKRQPYRPFIFLTNGDEIWLSEPSSNPRRIQGFLTKRELEARRFQLANRKPLAGLPIDGTIVERPYQHEAIRRVHDALSANKRKALLVMATGSGKTRVATALVDTLLRGMWVRRVLFLVDRRELGDQALEAFKEQLPSEPAAWISTGSYDRTKRLYVATLQTMQDFYKEFSPGDFDLIFSDECHRSIYNRWEVVLSYFDALLVGLTATPADYLDKNTFTFFGCPDNVPTFAYEYEQAVAEGYLVPFRVYHARTTVHINGFDGATAPPEVQGRLIEQGYDPDDITFAGTDLERKVSVKRTLQLHVTEFFENAIKDPGGSLPGKSIIFAISHAHAKRLWETFNEEYPQFPGLTEIIDSYMEEPGSLISRFKKEDLPRIAISVDMLDTGVDIPTVVNLAFMKPVLSKIKFWQMIGRGTRVVNQGNGKPWCPPGSKPNFRIVDFWDNFKRFQIDPAGVEPSVSTPVAVRYFRVLIRAARAAEQMGQPGLAEGFTSEARQMIAALPIDSAGVREHRKLIQEVAADSFWLA